jgi:hypothetical protein
MTKRKKNSGVLSVSRQQTNAIKRLVKKALKNGFKAKPAKNHMYLKDVGEGEYFDTGSLKGIKIHTGNMGTKVIIMDANVEEEDLNYYLGIHLIANTTEVLK